MLRRAITRICMLLILMSIYHGLNAHAGLSGKNYTIAKKFVSGSPDQISYDNNSLRALPCPAQLPNIALNSSVPQANPTPLPGAFYPNSAVSNSLTSPPQILNTNFTAANEVLDPEFDVTPPDTFGVAGLTQFVMGNNFGLVSFTKSGVRDGILDSQNAVLTNLDGDFSIRLSNFGARIYYDRLANRFVVVQLNGSTNFGVQGNNGVTLAVSDSGTLSNDTVWTVFTILDLTTEPDSNGCAGDVNAGGVLFDFPLLGIDNNALYLSTSVYLQSNKAWVTNNLLVIQKSSLYNAASPVFVTAFPAVTLTSLGDFVGDQQNFRATSTLVPLNNFDDPNPAFGYAISQDPEFFGRLNIYRIVGAGTQAPTLAGPFNLNVLSTYSTKTNPVAYAPFAGQLYGNIGLLEYVDDRLASSSHINKKQIYAAHSILVDRTGLSSNLGDRLGVRWYELDVTGDTTGNGGGTETVTTVPVLVQAGTIYDEALTNPLYYNVPAIMTNTQSDILITGTVSGVNQPISAFFVGKPGTEAKDGTLHVGVVAPNTFAVGSGPFTRSLGKGQGIFSSISPIGQLWGQTSYSSVDPVTTTTMWTIQEIAANGNQQLVVAEFLAS